MMLIAVFVGFILLIEQNNINKSNIKPAKVTFFSTKRALVLILVILSIALSLFILIKNSETDKVSRVFQIGIQDILRDGRWPVAWAVIQNIPKQPFGNMDMYWAHNLWLDVARVAGVIPMVYNDPQVVDTKLENIVMMEA